MNTQYQVVSGSISALAQQNNKSIAESFLNCEAIVVCDVSGSMSNADSRGGQSRYKVACEELAALQRNLPGKVAVVGFSDNVQFHPGGVPVFVGNGTDMAKALQFVKIADVSGIRIILISDGEPDDERETLKIARTFKSKIDVIFVGNESIPTGRDFLQKLAAVTGGKILVADRAKELSSGIKYLLEG